MTKDIDLLDINHKSMVCSNGCDRGFYENGIVRINDDIFNYEIMCRLILD